jgi:hypothetical protein
MTGLDPVTHAVRSALAVPPLLENPGVSWRRLVPGSRVGGRVKPDHDGNKTTMLKSDCLLNACAALAEPLKVRHKPPKPS